MTSFLYGTSNWRERKVLCNFSAGFVCGTFFSHPFVLEAEQTFFID